MAPAIAWMLEALQREGFDLNEVLIFAKSL
jgi:hypothetical protein